MVRPKITLTLIKKIGAGRWGHHGHCVGDTFDFDADRGKLCPMAMHVAFPFVDILRYGGTIPGQPEGTAVFCCPDADVINVFKAKIVPQT